MMTKHKHLIISPIHGTLIVGKIWMGLEYDAIISNLNGIDSQIKVEVIQFNELRRNLDNIPKGAFIFYSASYDESYQRYVRDTILSISFSRPDISLIPDIQSLFCFENKGYQELFRLNFDIDELWGEYIGDIGDFDQSRYTNFPYVVKKLGGALSSGVSLCKNYQELQEFVAVKKIPLKQRIKYYLRSKKATAEFSYSDEGFMLKNREEFFKFRQPFIIQEFIEGLACDYKVLVFGERLYVFKRFVRDDDFRASGSGKFVWERPSDNVLNYASKVFDKIDVPFVALDVAEKGDDCYLIEIQAIGFGPIGLDKSEGYYIREEGQWNYKEEKPNLERAYARAIYSHIQNSTHVQG